MPPITPSPLVQTLQTNPAVLNFSVYPLQFNSHRIDVGIFEGDIASVEPECDAYVAPHPRNHTYYHGANGVMREKVKGVDGALRQYSMHVEDFRGAQFPNHVCSIPLPGESVRKSLINVVSGLLQRSFAGPLFKTDENWVFRSVQAVLNSAERSKLDRVLFPPMGANDLGGLEISTAARMIKAAIEIYGEDSKGVRPSEILIGIHRAAGQEVADDLISHTYKTFVEVFEKGRN